MEVAVEKQSGIGRKLSISIAAEEFDKHINAELNKFKDSAKIAGFRKGKMPTRMLEQQFGGQAIRNAADTLISQYYPQALKQESLIPASLLKVTPTQVKRNKPFIFEVELEVYPEIAVPSFAEVEIIQLEVAVQDENVEKTMQSIRRGNTDYTEVDKKAANGDQVLVDFIGLIDGVAFAGGEKKEVPIVLGIGRFLPDFERGIIGAKKGDERNVQVTFPADYHSQEVANRTADFTITVKRVSEGELPILDDDFAVKVGVAAGIVAMRAEVRRNLERELSEKLRNDIRHQVMSVLVAGDDFPLPQVMVDDEVDRSTREITKQLEAHGIVAKDVVRRENYLGESKNRVKLGLLVRAVARAEKIQLDNDLLKQRIIERAGGYSDPAAYIQRTINSEEERKQISSVILEEQVVARLLESAKIKKVKQPYEKFINDYFKSPGLGQANSDGR